MNDYNLYIFIIIFSPIILLNFYACYVIFTTYFEVKERRLYQLIFVWIVPLLGSITVIFINREERLIKKPKRKIGNDTSIKNIDNRI